MHKPVIALLGAATIVLGAAHHPHAHKVHAPRLHKAHYAHNLGTYKGRRF